MKWILLALGLIMAMLGGLFVVVFVCASFEDWPYFRPVIAGNYHLREYRSDYGNGSIVAYTVVPGVEVRIGAFCYPRQPTGVQPCLLRFGLEKPPGVGVAIDVDEMAVRDRQGHDLVNRASARRYPNLAPNIPGKILLVEDMLPDEFYLSLPPIRVGETVKRLPDLWFERVEKRECVPLLTNY